MIWQPGLKMAEVERQVIEDAMRFHMGDKKAVARALGVSEKTIYNKLESYRKDDMRKIEEKNSRDEKNKKLLEEHRGPKVKLVLDSGIEEEEFPDLNKIKKPEVKAAAAQ